MEPKKSEKADLESKKGLFLQVGLVAVLVIILIAFEWTTREVRTGAIGEIADVVIEEEIIPVTRREEPPPPPPPAPVESDVFEIVDDDVDIKDEFIIDDAETRAVREDYRIMTTTVEEEEEEAEIFVIVEDMPTFQGEDHESFRLWIRDNLRYPQRAAEAGIQGRVIVEFVVEGDGTISNVNVLRGVDPSLDQEAVRVIESSPRWEPGRQRGEPVRVRFTFPINFVLE